MQVCSINNPDDNMDYIADKSVQTLLGCASTHIHRVIKMSDTLYRAWWTRDRDADQAATYDGNHGCLAKESIIAYTLPNGLQQPILFALICMSELTDRPKISW
jgi:hypothetical protein